MKDIFSKFRKKFFKFTFTAIKDFKIKSIQSIITISLTFLTIGAMIFMGLLLNNKYEKTAEKNALISTSQIIEQVNTNLGYYLKVMNDISNTISEELGNSNKASLDNLVAMTLKIRRDIVTLGVFSEDGESISIVPKASLKKGLNIKEQDWFKNVLDKPDRIYFSAPHVQNLFLGEYRWVVSLGRAVTVVRNGKAENLISLVDMNFNAIDEISSKVNLGKRGYVYIIDKEGNIIYHPQQQMIYAGLKKENIDFTVDKEDGSYIQNFNGEKIIVSIKTTRYTDWKVVGVSFYDEMVTTKKDIYYFFLTLLVISIVIVIIISIIISARISFPIKRLEKIMKRVENGELDINAKIEGEDEVKQLSNTFNLMIEKIRILMEQNKEESEEKRKSELKALQAQINPHFLYNTLDSIVWMAENGENEGVIKMVTALANLFRTSISRGEEIISIKDEIEHVRSYLTIQNMRYMDKFDFDILVDEEVMKYKTLKITLQPIIENAIYHGIKKSVDKGMIKIIAEIVNDKICFQVIDNGLGMSQEKVANLLKKHEKGNRKSGIGVKNVHERIQLYFGIEYGIEIESEEEVGTKVSIWVPKISLEEV